MFCGAVPLSSLKDEFLVFEDDKAVGSGNLSSTLQKLYIWEKKLYEEVRVCVSVSNWKFLMCYFLFIMSCAFFFFFDWRFFCRLVMIIFYLIVLLFLSVKNATGSISFLFWVSRGKAMLELCTGI